MDIKKIIISNCDFCTHYAVMSVLGENKCVLLTNHTDVDKTYPLKTIADEYIKRFSDKKVKLETFEDTINHFLKLIKDGKTDEFYEELISNDLILIENVEVEGKISTQQELAFWVSQVITEDKNIIISTADNLKNLTVLTDSISKMCNAKFVHMEISKPDMKFV